jgi:hypothetical protein
VFGLLGICFRSLSVRFENYPNLCKQIQYKNDVAPPSYIYYDRDSNERVWQAEGVRAPVRMLAAAGLTNESKMDAVGPPELVRMRTPSGWWPPKSLSSLV